MIGGIASLDGRLGGPQSRSGRGDCGGEKESHYCPCGNWTPVIQPV